MAAALAAAPAGSDGPVTVGIPNSARPHPASGSSPAYRLGRYVPPAAVANLRPAVLQHPGGLLDVQAVHARRSLVGLDPLPAPLQVLSRQRLRPAGRAPEPFPIRRARARASSLRLARGFTALAPRLAPVAQASDACAFHSTCLGLSSLVRPFVPRQRSLLRPLLTSRSGLSRRPFRHEARSPQVRTHSFPAQPPDLRHRP